MVSGKGSRRERELLELLSSQGFVVHRIAGSGMKDSAICDLVAIDNKGKTHFIEVKSRKKYYYTKEHLGQLQEMIRIAKTCKAKPILAVKLNYKDWKIIDISKKIPERVI